MIRQNATMTMESWMLPPFLDEGGGTFSHPWTASPAFIIPRYLMGVRPLMEGGGWDRVAIRPLPPSKLGSAAMMVPLLRGQIHMSFSADPSSFTLNLTVPGATGADVCLPAYLYPQTPRCALFLQGEPVPHREAGALLCL